MSSIRLALPNIFSPEAQFGWRKGEQVGNKFKWYGIPPDKGTRIQIIEPGTRGKNKKPDAQPRGKPQAQHAPVVDEVYTRLAQLTPEDLTEETLHDLAYAIAHKMTARQLLALQQRLTGGNTAWKTKGDLARRITAALPEKHDFAGGKALREKAQARQLEKGQPPLPAGHRSDDLDEHEAHSIMGKYKAKGIDLAGHVEKHLAKGTDVRTLMAGLRGASEKEKNTLGHYYVARLKEQAKPKESPIPHPPTGPAKEQPTQKPAAPKPKGPISQGEQQKLATDLRKELGKKATLKLLGAPEGSTILSATKVYKDVSGEHGPNILYGFDVEVDYPQLKDCTRFIGVDGEGNRFIYVSLTEVKEEYKGRGLGTAMFAAMVEEAAAGGFAYLNNFSAGSPADAEIFNGYYTWPRLGYDESLDAIEVYDREVIAAVRERWPDAKTVLDVFEKPGGPQWWKENGTALHDARFDLSEGSRSRKVLDAYLAAKKEVKSRGR